MIDTLRGQKRVLYSVIIMGDETEKVIAEATRQRMKNDLGEACSLPPCRDKSRAGVLLE